MAAIRTVGRLGHNIRKQHHLRVRQPVASVTVLTRDEKVEEAVSSHIDLIGDELNVKAITTSRSEGDLVDLSARANFKTLGPRLGKRVKEIDGALRDTSAADLHHLQDGATISVGGEELSLDDVILQRTPKPGVVVATEGTVSVAIDIELTDELIVEGYAREIVNRIQTARRDEDLDVTDRIAVKWSSSEPRIAEAFAVHSRLITDEVLATSLERGEVEETHNLAGVTFGLKIDRTIG